MTARRVQKEQCIEMPLDTLTKLIEGQARVEEQITNNTNRTGELVEEVKAMRKDLSSVNTEHIECRGKVARLWGHNIDDQNRSTIVLLQQEVKEFKDKINPIVIHTDEGGNETTLNQRVEDLETIEKGAKLILIPVAITAAIGIARGMWIAVVAFLHWLAHGGIPQPK